MEGEYESIFIETQHYKKNSCWRNIYRIPDTNIRTSINRYDTIISKLTDTNKDLIIATDQKCDYLQFYQHKNTEDLLNIILNNGIIPTITKPTRITHTSATLIDNIYTRSTNKDRLYSDHAPVCLFLSPAAPKARDGRYCNALRPSVCLSVCPSVCLSVRHV